MSTIYNISEKPTFDLQDIELIYFDPKERILLFRTTDIYHFDKVYGNVCIRSRVMRPEKEEFKLVKNIASAIIDAWYYGYIHWKIELTEAWVELCSNTKDLNSIIDKFKWCQQIFLFQSMAWNYYNWSNNNPDLVPDIIFTL